MVAKNSSPKALSAGIVIVRPDELQHRYLLLRFYHYWDFPKGAVEPGEDPLSAARREVAEETTLTELNFRWGDRYCETEPYGNRKVARYYVAQTGQTNVQLLKNPQLGRAEHHGYDWMTYDKARELLVPRLVKVLDWAVALTTRAV